MKLPGIQYGKPVESLGRQPITAVGAAASAAAAARLATLRAGGQVVKQINDQIQVSEYNKAWTDYQTEMDEIEKENFNRPYSEDDEGNLTPRYDTVKDDYKTSEKEVKNKILSRMYNSKAKRRFGESTMAYGVAADKRNNTVSLTWKRNHAKSETLEAIQDHINSGRYYDAEAAYIAAAAAGTFSEKEMTEIPIMIGGHEQYNSVDSRIDETRTGEDFISIREDLGKEELYWLLDKKQRVALDGALTQKVEDSLVDTARKVMEANGLSGGQTFIRAVNKSTLDKLGLSEEDDKFNIVTRLQQVYADYKWETEQNKSAVDLQNRINLIKASGAADPKKGIDKKAYDAIFEEELEGTFEFSPDWKDTTVKMTSIYGWMPPEAESRTRAYLTSENPQNIVDSARLLQEVEKASPRSLENIPKDDIAFAITINEHAKFGVPEIDTINKIRDGIYRVPPSIRENRRVTFKKEVRKNAENILKDLVNEDDEANPWFSFRAEFPVDMQAEFSSILETEYVRTGDQGIAAKFAYRTVRGIWGVTDRGDGLKLERNSPEAFLTGGKPEKWLTGQYKHDMKEINLDPDDVELIYDQSGGKQNRWIIINKETKEAKIGKNGTIQMFVPDYATSPEAKKKEAEGKKKRDAAESQQKRLRDREAAKSSLLEEGLELEDIGGELIEEDVLSIEDIEHANTAQSRKTAIAEATYGAAIKGWEFLLDDIPKWWKGKKLPENYTGARE